MSTNFLASFFNKVREIVEAAETPFAKLAIFILPIISPLVPATMTGLHIYKLMLAIFDFGEYAEIVAVSTSAVVSTVLELLGYVGAVLFIQSIYQWIRTLKAQYFLPAILNGLAYGFYLYLMWNINYKLGLYFGTPDIMNQIVGWLSFITVPTGLLAANHLSQKQITEEDYTLRQERREDALKSKALKNGINIFSQPAQPQPSEGGTYREVKEKHASDYRDKIIAMLDAEYGRSKNVLTPKQITERLKLNHSNNKGFVSTRISEWKKEKGIL